MNDRRHFLKKILGSSMLLSMPAVPKFAFASPVESSFERGQYSDKQQFITDEERWSKLRSAYAVSSKMINLNNGGVSPQPKVVLEAEKKFLSIINELPSLQLLRLLPKNRVFLRQKLAKIAGCNADELAIMQNATQAIHTAVMGQDWVEGDEVVLSTQDYSTVKVGFEQLVRRKKIKLVWVQFPVPVEDDATIVEAYCSKFSKRTKMVFITHLTNWTGQIIPNEVIRSICLKAAAQNIFSLVDGAHAFAQINFKIKDLHCDAYATSLHKWLSAPIGMGFLFLRKDKIEQVWPLYPAEARNTSVMNKFENFGTISLAKEEATHYAIDFFYLMGIELKEARLRYLKNYWMLALSQEDGVQIHTSSKDRYACAIALFSVEGISFKKVSSLLEKKYKIHNTISVFDSTQGVRISPNIYTRKKDLDKFLCVMREILKGR
jgi:selenocysteine lyase/cysteine desulfurase